MLPYFHKSTLRKGGFLYLLKPVEVGISGEAMLCTIVFNNVSPLPCSHPACSEFCVHLEFLPEIVCKVGKVCKVEKVRSTFHTVHDYLNFYGEKKDDRLFTIYAHSEDHGLQG